MALARRRQRHGVGDAGRTLGASRSDPCGAGNRDRHGLISWTNHDAGAAAPGERDHDEVVGFRGGAVRRPDRAIFGFEIELSPSRMRAVSYIRAANGALKRPSDLRRLAPLAII